VLAWCFDEHDRASLLRVRCPHVRSFRFLPPAQPQLPFIRAVRVRAGIARHAASKRIHSLDEGITASRFSQGGLQAGWPACEPRVQGWEIGWSSAGHPTLTPHRSAHSAADTPFEAAMHLRAANDNRRHALWPGTRSGHTAVRRLAGSAILAALVPWFRGLTGPHGLAPRRLKPGSWETGEEARAEAARCRRAAVPRRWRPEQGVVRSAPCGCTLGRGNPPVDRASRT